MADISDDDLAFETAWARARTEDGDPKPIRFTLDGEEFFAVPKLPAGQLIQTVGESAAAKTNVDEAKVHRDFLDAVLLPDSAKRIAERMLSPTEPLDETDLQAMAVGLMRRYSGRPTTPPASSPSSPDAGGEPSTPGQPSEGEG